MYLALRAALAKQDATERAADAAPVQFT